MKFYDAMVMEKIFTDKQTTFLSRRHKWSKTVRSGTVDSKPLQFREAWNIMVKTDPIRGHEKVETLKQLNIKLYGSEQPTFDALVNKYKAKGFALEKAVQEILQNAARTNKHYDDMSLSVEKLGGIPLPANSQENQTKLSIS